jgi:hypothetical protein
MLIISTIYNAFVQGFEFALRGAGRREMGGRVRGGLISSFNIYISHVKKIQNEERGTSRRFFLEFFFVMMGLQSKKRNNELMITTELKAGPLYTYCVHTVFIVFIVCSQCVRDKVLKVLDIVCTHTHTSHKLARTHARTHAHIHTYTHTHRVGALCHSTRAVRQDRAPGARHHVCGGDLPRALSNCSLAGGGNP